jgi:hypothetical protein
MATKDLPWYIPFDPLMRIWLKNIHNGKHGGDTGVLDTEGR